VRRLRLRKNFPRASAACTSLSRRGARRLSGFVQLLGDLVQRTLDVFLGRSQPWNAAFIHGLLRVFDGLFGLLYIRLADLSRFSRSIFFGLIHDAIQAVARFDLFHPAAVVFRMRFGFCPHLFGLFLASSRWKR